MGDREYWVSLLDKIASPILSNMSVGLLKQKMNVVYSPTWEVGRNKQIAYMEAFARLIAGLAPFLSLKNENIINSFEKETQSRLYQQTIASLNNCVDKNNPDYFYWQSKQSLVESAYMAQAFLSAPEVLWEPLNENTKKIFIEKFIRTRNIVPPNNNWILFSAMVECFLLFINKPFKAKLINKTINKIKSWYVGDGWYSDGEKFHFDHYNGYVIHPMFVEILRISLLKNLANEEEYNLAYKRMQRYASFQERYISPEGTFLIIGRSSTYRAGVFQPLAKLALDKRLPEEIKPSQVRCALTSVLKNIFIEETFTKDGFLTLGFIGKDQTNIADYYSNTGSMYITSLVFLPLGLKDTDPFWSDPFCEWTQLKAWKGKPFVKDYAVEY